MRCYVPSFLPLVAALCLAAGPGLASDGVLEINQTCAVGAGCFPGDSANLPVTITTPGSYRLTSNLTVPNDITDGIVVSTSDVGIDLNNFAILGPVICSGSPTTCTSSGGNGSGVERSSSTHKAISVKNGSIRGMGNYGVQLGEQAEVTNLRVRSNRNHGIFALNGSTVSGNTAHYNGGAGIFTGPGSTVSGNTAHNNGSVGIYADGGSTVSGNTAYNNGSNGIASAGDGSTVSGNTSSFNGSNGISANSGSTIQRNTVRANTGFGLNIGTDSTYRENTITSNTAGTVNGIGEVNKGDNHCSGPGTVSAFCP